MIKIGIVGSRRRDTFHDKAKIFMALHSKLSWLYHKEGVHRCEISIVSGGCPKGADRFAEELAEEQELPIIIHYPDKSKINPILNLTNPRLAWAEVAFARNRKIAEDSDYLIACVSEDRTGGTENTIKHFKELGKEKNLILV